MIVWTVQAVSLVLGVVSVLILWGAGMLGLEYLAGGGILSAPLPLFVFWPIAGFIMMITLVFDHGVICPPRSGWRFWIPGKRTALWLGYYLSPIWLNLASIGLRWAKWEQVADSVFGWRWNLWFIIPLGLLAFMIASVLICQAIEWTRTRWAGGN